MCKTGHRCSNTSTNAGVPCLFVETFLERLQRCSRCLAIAYCSKRCQKVRSLFTADVNINAVTINLHHAPLMYASHQF